jgi:CrcB protein
MTNSAATTALIWAVIPLVGGIGAVLRFLIDRAVMRRAGRPFPFGTLTVNTSGAALFAFLGGLELSAEAALLAGASFVGAYTTFSTWMLETQRLGEERQNRAALGNIFVSVALGLAAAGFGQWAAQQI